MDQSIPKGMHVDNKKNTKQYNWIILDAGCKQDPCISPKRVSKSHYTILALYITDITGCYLQ